MNLLIAWKDSFNSLSHRSSFKLHVSSWSTIFSPTSSTTSLTQLPSPPLQANGWNIISLQVSKSAFPSCYPVLFASRHHSFNMYLLMLTNTNFLITPLLHLFLFVLSRNKQLFISHLLVVKPLLILVGSTPWTKNWVL